MRFRVLGFIRAVMRRTLPVVARRAIWKYSGHDYFERASIKAVIAHVVNSRTVLSPNVKTLISALKEDRYKPDIPKIKAILGIDFKAYSYQDLIAYIFFNGKTSGFFVDIGAYDGISISNTYALESLGWDGVCVEPIPEIYALLEINRKCITINAAITNSKVNSAKFIKVHEQEGLSGLEHQMPDRIRRGLADQGHTLELIKVNTTGFQEILKGYSSTEIDFLSIDVEGGEIDVLDSIDFGKYTFSLITIENNAGTAMLIDYLGLYGYQPFIDLGVDLMFIRNS